MKTTTTLVIFFLGCSALLPSTSYAQDSLVYYNNISAGVFSGQEFYLTGFKDRDDTGYRDRVDPDYKLSSTIYYLKFLRKYIDSHEERGFSTAVSIGEVSNNVRSSKQATSKSTLPANRASRSRVAVSIMYRYNYFLIDTKRTNIYLGGGIGLRATYYRNYTTNDPEYKRENIYKIYWPIAFEGVAGLRYFFLNNVGLYIEAGLSKSLLQGGVSCRF